MKIISKLSSIEVTFHTTSGPVVLKKGQASDLTKEQYDELMTQQLFKTYIESKSLEVLGGNNDSVSTSNKSTTESDDSATTSTTPARVRSTKADS